MENLKAIIEALIYVSEMPLSAIRIKEILGDYEKSQILEVIRELEKEYEDRQSGLILQEIAGGFQFRTRPDLSSWIKKMKNVKPTALSQPALETLAIIAYRQPVVKADIERMRGVDVSGPLKGLLEKKFVKMAGRKDVPGKPILYGTTKRFLEVFNLNSLSGLPSLRELKELHEDYEAQARERAKKASDSEELPFMDQETKQESDTNAEQAQEDGCGLKEPEDTAEGSVITAQAPNPLADEREISDPPEEELQDG